MSEMNRLVHLNTGFPSLYITICSHSLFLTLALCGHISQRQWHQQISSGRVRRHLHVQQILRPFNSLWAQCAASYPQYKAYLLAILLLNIKPNQVSDAQELLRPLRKIAPTFQLNEQAFMLFLTTAWHQVKCKVWCKLTLMIFKYSLRWYERKKTSTLCNLFVCVFHQLLKHSI